jgi:hypothetical protein
MEVDNKSVHDRALAERLDSISAGTQRSAPEYTPRHPQMTILLYMIIE